MSEVRIQVSRCNPDVDEAPRLEEFVVPRVPGGNVLQALMHIYDNVDSTLAFRYGCRLKNCGLCGVSIDGKPRLACLTALKDGMVIEPLPKLPLIRDLVVDRAWLFSTLERLQLYIPDDLPPETFDVIVEPEEHKQLTKCIECLCCLAACPSYEFDNSSLGGPYHFVKLAQLHFDPRDPRDRAKQAAELGVDRCSSCRKCYCPVGIKVYKLAVQPLSKQAQKLSPTATGAFESTCRHAT